MLDITLLREHPDLVKKNLNRRGNPAYAHFLDDFLHLDKQWRELKGKTDELRHERNKLTLEITKLSKEKKDISQLIKKAKSLPEEIKKNEERLITLQNKSQQLLMSLPNLVDKSVPDGDASHNNILKSFGKPKKLPFTPKDHADILESLGLLDTKKASEVAGSRFYYLKGDAVKLYHGLLQFALDFLRNKHFTLIHPPYMLRREALEGALPFAAFEEMIYKIEGEDLHLIGTAEHAINAYYMNETLPADSLPARFAGISPCFRKELGSHGKDPKGIFRVHQFEKVEQFVFCKPEEAWKEFDLLLKNSEELLKKLEIPFRFVVLASQDMGRVPTKTVDFECWFPSQHTYRELGSCSNCLDYQSRRSNIKYQNKNELSFVYTLNNTGLSVARMLACFVDNHQQKNGTIKIPKALWKYAGFKEIKPSKPTSKKKAGKKNAQRPLP